MRGLEGVGGGGLSGCMGQGITCEGEGYPLHQGLLGLSSYACIIMYL